MHQPFLSKLKSLIPSFVSLLNDQESELIKDMEVKGDAVGKFALNSASFFIRESEILPFLQRRPPTNRSQILLPRLLVNEVFDQDLIEIKDLL